MDGSYDCSSGRSIIGTPSCFPVFSPQGRSSLKDEKSHFKKLKDRARDACIESNQYYDIRLEYAEKKDTGVNKLSFRLSNAVATAVSIFDEDGEAPAAEVKAFSKAELNRQNNSILSNIAASEVERAVEFEESGARSKNLRSTNFFADPESKENPTENDLFYRLSSFTGSGLLQTYSLVDKIWQTEPVLIYRARHRYDSLFYTIKQVACEPLSDEKYLKSHQKAANEIQALSVLEHKNIVSFYCSWSEIGYSFLKLEYCIGGSLRDYLLSPAGQDGAFRRLRIVTAATILSHIGEALDYIFSRFRMTHGNIEAESILIQMPLKEALNRHKTVDELIEAAKNCHARLDADDVTTVTFKLSSFGKAAKAPHDVPENEARVSDVAALAKTLLFGADLFYESHASARGFLRFMEKLLTQGGYTVSAVLDHLRSRRDEYSDLPQAMDTS
ncbi:hypothetical protein Aperf_G00000105580 [Anoplocephala perfoliata]